MTSRAGKIFFIFVFLSCVTAILLADEKPSARQLMDAVHKVSDLSVLGPYVLTADVVISSGGQEGQQTGRLTIYRDHDRSRQELVIGGDPKVRFTKGNNLYFDPHQEGLGYLADFDQNWDPASPRRGLLEPIHLSGHVSREKVHDIAAWCIDVDKSNWNVPRRLCFDSSRSVLVRETRNGRTTEYSEYSSLGPQVFPQRVSIQGSEVIEVSHIKVQPTELKPELFDVPDRMLELGYCQGMKRPQPLSTPEPVYPKIKDRSQANRVVLLEVLVTKQGNVEAVKLVRTAGKQFDDAAMNAVRNWKFRPAACGADPVNVQMNIEVAFNL